MQMPNIETFPARKPDQSSTRSITVNARFAGPAPVLPLPPYRRYPAPNAHGCDGGVPPQPPRPWPGLYPSVRRGCCLRWLGYGPTGYRGGLR